MSSGGPTAGLLSYTRDKIAVVDTDGTFTYANEATSRILGYEPGQLVGTVAWQYVHPEDRVRVRSRFECTAAADEYAEAIEMYRHRAADGSWVWLESRFSNVTDEAFDGYVVSSREVTERVEAKTGRQAADRRLAELAEKTSEVLWMFDGAFSELLFCNTRYEEVYGASIDRLQSDPTAFLEAVHPDDVAAVEDAMARLVDGDSVDVEYRVDPTTEYDTWVWVQGDPIFEDEEVVRIVGFARDVTDRRQRERQLAVMDTLLRHNLRNDMNAIIANAELIAEHPNERPGERAGVIRRVGERLVETAEKERRIIDLLQKPVRLQRVPLARRARNVVKALCDQYPEATVRADVEPATVRALEPIDEAICELLENALQHAADPEPTARVTVETVGKEAVLCVCDNCPPIPEHEYRVLTGEQEMTAMYHSSGLGLWLVHWIVDLSDGSVEFDRADDGNVATITLPRV